MPVRFLFGSHHPQLALNALLTLLHHHRFVFSEYSPNLYFCQENIADLTIYNSCISNDKSCCMHQSGHDDSLSESAAYNRLTIDRYGSLPQPD
jgi:hypothetical protein